jgi:hypothetical protein
MNQRCLSFFLVTAISLISIGVLPPLLGQRAAASSPAPKLAFIPETKSVGVVSQWTVRVFDLIVENRGDADLILKEAAPSCGCTTISPAFDKVIKPGGKTKIKVTFNSRDFTGLVTKSVLVSSNDPAHPIREFVFTAFVQ